MLQAVQSFKATRPLKPRKCRHCKEPFIRARPLQVVCGWPCGLAVAKQIAEKQERARVRAEKAADRAKREAMRPISYWVRQAQWSFNCWIKQRDAAAPCISCGTTKPPEAWIGGDGYHAGHFLSTASAPELRFDESNVHKQCVKCNVHLSGNIARYRISLIERIGLAEVERLEGPHEPKRYRADELKAIRDIYRARLKAAQGELNVASC